MGTLDGREEGRGARGDDELVVRDLAPLTRMHDLLLAVDAAHAVSDVELHVVLCVPALGGELELAGVPVPEVLGHVHSVVGGAVLLGKGNDLKVRETKTQTISNAKAKKKKEKEKEKKKEKEEKKKENKEEKEKKEEKEENKEKENKKEKEENNNNNNNNNNSDDNNNNNNNNNKRAVQKDGSSNHLVLSIEISLHHLLDEVESHHAVPDDDDILLRDLCHHGAA